MTNMKTQTVGKKSLLCAVGILLVCAVLALCLCGTVTSRADTADGNGVLYFVDCGTDDATGAAGRIAGALNNGTFDQEYTGSATWGWYNSPKTYNESSGTFVSIRSGDSPSDGTVIYKFTVPAAGDYTVSVALNDPWPQAARKIDVKVKGEGEEKVIGSALVANSGIALAAGTYTTTQENEVITVTASKSAGNSKENPHVAAIVITTADTVLPLYASGLSPYDVDKIKPANGGTLTIGDDLSEVRTANADVTLYFNNGESVTYRATDGGVRYALKTQNIGIGVAVQEVATLDAYKDFPVITKEYTWAQTSGDGELYYNIDVGYTDKANPPKSMEEIGSKQSETYDREFSADSDDAKNTSWGYVGAVGGANWADSKDNEWSIREQGANGLTYKMTGFAPNERLTIETGGHCGDNWGGRTYSVSCNGTQVGSITLENGKRTYSTFDCQADASGELTVFYNKTSGDGAQVGYIKVRAATAESDITVSEPKDSYTCAESVSLGNLDTNGRVYVIDQNNVLVRDFVPEAATGAVKVADCLTETTTRLSFIQASATLAASQAVTVTVTPHSYDYEHYVWEWGEGKTSATATVKCSADETHTLTYRASISRTTESQASCETEGRSTVTATVLMGGQTVVKTDETVIAALGHTYDFRNAEWTWNDDLSAASITLQCMRDSNHVQHYDATIEQVTTPALCEQDGNVEYIATVTVGVRKFTDTRTKVLEPAGHDYSVVVWEWDGTSAATASLVCAHDSTEVKESAQATVSVTVTQPTTKADGERKYTATVTLDGKQYTDVKTETIPATGDDDEPGDDEPGGGKKKKGCGSVAGGGTLWASLAALIAVSVCAVLRKKNGQERR